VKRLVKISDQMRQQEKRLLLGGDLERRRRGTFEQDRDCSVDGGDNVVIVGALTFFPALSLGPIVEHLLMASGQVF